MKKTFRTFIAVIMTVTPFMLLCGQTIASQGDMIIETEALSMTGKREDTDTQARVNNKMYDSEKIVVTDQITYTGKRSEQQ